jgi:hypothetical protein
MQYLTRLIDPSLKDATLAFKAVLILGARQVGKSTLLQHLFPNVKRIVFDPLQDLYGARRDPLSRSFGIETEALGMPDCLRNFRSPHSPAGYRRH